jgi:hypothetical protein
MKKIEEEWKTIEGFPKYEISNFGRCRNIARGRNLLKKFQRKMHGICIYTYSLYSTSSTPDTAVIRRNHTAGMLVAKAFVENPNNYKFIEYIDGDPSNAIFTNIRWVKNIDQKNYKIDPFVSKLPKLTKEDQVKNLTRKIERAQRLLDAIQKNEVQKYVYEEILPLCRQIVHHKHKHKDDFFKERMINYALDRIAERIDRGYAQISYEYCIRMEINDFIRHNKQLKTVEIDERRI